MFNTQYITAFEFNKNIFPNLVLLFWRLKKIRTCGERGGDFEQKPGDKEMETHLCLH